MTATLRRALALVTAFVLMVSVTPITDINATSKPKLSKTKATVTVGKSTTLSVKNLSKGSVKWSSSAKKIATVNQKGKVTGVKTGTAKITAKVKKSSKTYTLKCTVTVKKSTAATVTTTASEGSGPIRTTRCARIGDTEYVSLQAAVNTADTTPLTITLIDDTVEDVIIWTGDDITLDLNGHSITNVAANNHDTITLLLDAKLTIVGKGTVDNVSSGKSAIYNNGTAILNGGTYDRSVASSKNKAFTICNHGRMTIDSGATVQNAGGSGSKGQYSSLIENGYYSYTNDYVSNVGISKPTLTINGGTFRGGLYAIENDDGGTLFVESGTFTDFYQAALINHHVATVNGGIFTATSDSANANKTTYVVENCGCEALHDQGLLTISGGTFTGATYALRERSSKTSSVTITGGTFEGKTAAIIAKTGNLDRITIEDGTFLPVMYAE